MEAALNGARVCVFAPVLTAGGPGTCACALRRKMYDPQRVEGTPPSGLLLTESIKQHLAPTGVWAAHQISRLGSCSTWLLNFL